MKKIICIFLFCVSFSSACYAGLISFSREDLLKSLPNTCRQKYQARLICKEAGDTLWVYLPYLPGRSGSASVSEKESELYIEYNIASFNPYKVVDPPELRFLVQKLLAEIRGALLSCSKPYKFFILVVTDISSPANKNDEWYIGYFDDLLKYRVCLDFSGEGYDRLVWHSEKMEKAVESGGQSVSAAFLDIKGEHLDYREMTLREFVEKQIKWRVYKRFTIGYNKIPFDLSKDEKRDEVIKIINAVLDAYNYREFQTVFLRDLAEEQVYNGYPKEKLEKYKAKGISRKPAF